MPRAQESFLDEGFILDKRIGVGQPKRVEDAKILVANTPMDTDKVKIYGARVRVDSMQKARSGTCCSNGRVFCRVRVRLACAWTSCRRRAWLSDAAMVGCRP